MKVEDCVGRQIACNQCGRPSPVTPVDPRPGPGPAASPAILTAHLWFRRVCPFCGVKLIPKGTDVTPIESAEAT
jgi:hypothetical protein